MRRGFYITIRLMVVVILLRPFGCFAAATPSSQAPDCCLKAKCIPTANSDECCKNTVPDNDQLAPSRAAELSSPPIVLALVHIPVSPAFLDGGGPVSHPPPDASLASAGLPLLI